MNCRICTVKLNQPEFPETRDCGGDCLKCMAEVAEDPDCIKAMQAINTMRRFHQGEETPYNGGVQYSCKTCGALVDQHNLDTHDEFHRKLDSQLQRLFHPA